MSSRKNKNYGVEPKYILMLCVLFCILLILGSYKLPRIFKPISRAVNSMLVPMQKGIHVIGAGIDDVKAKFDDIDELRAEKKALEAEIEKLKEKNEQLQ